MPFGIGAIRTDFGSIKDQECELDKWVSLFGFFNDPLSAYNPVKVEKLLSCAPTPGKKVGYGFDPAFSTNEMEEFEKWSEVAATLKEINTF